MKVLLVVVLSIWVMCIGTWGITLEVGDESSETGYSTFLGTLRNQVKDAKLVYYGIPMLPKPATPPNYLLVELKIDAQKTITLAINKNNLYVVGYADKYQEKPRAHFFPDAPSNAKTSLFPDAKAPLRLTINYQSTYGGNKGLEAKAGSRLDVGLGIQKLKEFILQVYGKAIDDKKESKLLLIAIQMVSEAARFKYIESQVVLNFHSYTFTPDYKTLDLENSWGKISTAIRKSKDGNISPPLIISSQETRGSDIVGSVWEVKKVSEISAYMGLLNYVA